MKIKIHYYPDTFEFETKKPLPNFEYGCEIRGQLLLKKLKKLEVYSPNHAYEDYIVEEVEIIDGLEVWHIGS